MYKKHYPPALNDEVWRLEKIGKDGAFHKRLNKAGIFTVEEFLQLVVQDSQKLRNVSAGLGLSCKNTRKNTNIFVPCRCLCFALVYRSLEVECQTRCGRLF